MVAVIKVSSSLSRLLNYNENKAKQGRAVCLAAMNFPVDAKQLTFTMKLKRFERQMELNRNVKSNSMHISLNFDPTEKDMPTEKLLAIAQTYLERLGFGDQPCLVYRHCDAGHPHIHLVTNNIRYDGSRIDLHHLAIRKSEPARKEIEATFGLIKAESRKNIAGQLLLQPAKKVAYGKSETRAALQNVLGAVLDKYTYTSLHEFNAVLNLYNVKADPGQENSRVNRHKGLLYHITDEKGNTIGIPIKASLFHNQPTLARLAVKFSKNKIIGQSHKARIKNTIDHLDKSTVKGFKEVEERLFREGISMVKRSNNKGFLYGITYVDHTTGGVFNGSALGKAYSARAIQERFLLDTPNTSYKVGNTEKGLNSPDGSLFRDIAIGNSQMAGIIQDIEGILYTLSRDEMTTDYLPRQWKKKKKRKRRGPSTNT